MFCKLEGREYNPQEYFSYEEVMKKGLLSNVVEIRFSALLETDENSLNNLNSLSWGKLTNLKKLHFFSCSLPLYKFPENLQLANLKEVVYQTSDLSNELTTQLLAAASSLTAFSMDEHSIRACKLDETVQERIAKLDHSFGKRGALPRSKLQPSARKDEASQTSNQSRKINTERNVQNKAHDYELDVDSEDNNLEESDEESDYLSSGSFEQQAKSPDIDDLSLSQHHQHQQKKPHKSLDSRRRGEDSDLEETSSHASTQSGGSNATRMSGNVINGNESIPGLEEDASSDDESIGVYRVNRNRSNSVLSDITEMSDIGNERTSFKISYWVIGDKTHPISSNQPSVLSSDEFSKLSPEIKQRISKIEIVSHGAENIFDLVDFKDCSEVESLKIQNAVISGMEGAGATGPILPKLKLLMIDNCSVDVPGIVNLCSTSTQKPLVNLINISKTDGSLFLDNGVFGGEFGTFLNELKVELPHLRWGKIDAATAAYDTDDDRKDDLSTVSHGTIYERGRVRFDTRSLTGAEEPLSLDGVDFDILGGGSSFESESKKNNSDNDYVERAQTTLPGDAVERERSGRGRRAGGNTETSVKRDSRLTEEQRPEGRSMFTSRKGFLRKPGSATNPIYENMTERLRKGGVEPPEILNPTETHRGLTPELIKKGAKQTGVRSSNPAPRSIGLRQSLPSFLGHHPDSGSTSALKRDRVDKNAGSLGASVLGHQSATDQKLQEMGNKSKKIRNHQQATRLQDQTKRGRDVMQRIQGMARSLAINRAEHPELTIEAESRTDVRSLYEIEEHIDKAVSKHIKHDTMRYNIDQDSEKDVVHLSFSPNERTKIPMLTASSESVTVHKSWRRMVDPEDKKVSLEQKALLVLGSLGIPPCPPDIKIDGNLESRFVKEIAKQFKILQASDDEEIEVRVTKKN